MSLVCESRYNNTIHMFQLLRNGVESCVICNIQSHESYLVRVGPRAFCYTVAHLPSNIVEIACSGVRRVELMALPSYGRATLRTNTALHGSSALWIWVSTATNSTLEWYHLANHKRVTIRAIVEMASRACNTVSSGLSNCTIASLPKLKARTISICSSNETS